MYHAICLFESFSYLSIEDCYFESLLVADICRVPYTKENIDEFIKAIKKIKNNIEELKKYEKNSVAGA